MNGVSNGRSSHFALHSLSDGVFAAIAEDGGSAICNAGLIDLGGQIVVFDTFLTPQAARDLRQTAVDLFGRTPQIAVNSHYHNDHVWGNQVFAPDAQIVSGTRTRALMATEGAEELRWYSANSAERLASLRARYQTAADEEQRRELLLWIGEYGGVVEALPHLAVCMPGVTFDKRLEIHGARRTAELITYEGGHTGSDSVLYLPAEGIVFMSDLLFVRFHPYLAEGDPAQLMGALRELSRLDAHCFIPGHGPVGTVDDLELLIAYIEHCVETAQGTVDRGDAGADAIAALEIPDRYRHWRLAQFYRTNIRALCERESSARGNQ
jgi:cyclase